jgi:hypothetical protein
LGRYALKKYNKVENIETYKKNKESKIVNNVTLAVGSLGGFFFTTFFNSDNTTIKTFLASAACACSSAYFFNKAHTAYRKKNMDLITLKDKAGINLGNFRRLLSFIPEKYYSLTSIKQSLFPSRIGIDE